MSSNYLFCLFEQLKENYKLYYLLSKNCLLEKNQRKNEIRFKEIKELEEVISKLKEKISNYLDKFKQIFKLKEEIINEKQKKKLIIEKNKKFSDFIENCKNILTNNVSYFHKLPDYSNKKLKTAKISPLELINFALRINQQSKSPKEGDFFFSKYLPYSLNERQNSSVLYNDYFIKNKNRYLFPYPDGLFGLQNTILRYDLSEKNRLLPPTLDSPNPSNVNENGEILANKGKDLLFKYPDENPPQEIFYKYSRDPNIIPSFFSGEIYQHYSPPNLDKNCIIKVCTCKKGFKDSKIVTFKFVIDSNEVEQFEEKKVDIKAGPDVIIRPEEHFDPGSLVFGAVSSFSSNSPKGTTNRPGTSSYEAEYFNPEDQNDEEDDEI